MLVALVIAVLAFFTPSASPATLAYARVQWSSDGQNVTASIWTMRADGSQRRRLTGKGAWTDTTPGWSRDGKRIAFGRMDAGGWRILVASAQGTNVRALVSRRGLADAPTWSPDGRLIAFTGMPKKIPMVGTVTQQIWIVSVATGRLRVLTHVAAGASAPEWSPDGRWIAYTAWSSLGDNARVDIWRVRPNGSGARLVVRDADGSAWSPDGKRLAFSRDGDIYTVRVDGRDLRRVTRTPRAGDTEPSWSDSGIAYASMHRAANQANDDMLVAVSRPDGTLLHTVRDGDPLIWMDAPAWKP